MVKNDSKYPLDLHLRRAREDRGWSQQDLAKEIGTTSVNVSRWEHGSHFPNPHFRQLLCQAFGQTPAELGLVPPAQDIRIVDIPIMRNSFFTGREGLLALLHRRLMRERAAALIQAQAHALYGLGGIGKTQTAAEYVFRYGEEYAQVFWILAASRETLAGGPRGLVARPG
jgi:transcriptional regulator with XRE-family HTH domain